MTGRVAIIGGGFAGFAAAARLAGDGVTPILLERTRRFGGRAASFDDAVTGEIVDYGHHVLMRCCTAAHGFLQRIGASDLVRIQPELEIPILADGRTTTLRSAPLPGVLHLAPSLLRYAPLSVGERLGVVRGALPLLLAARSRDEAFGPWLRRHGQGSRVVDRLWNPICVAALNAPAEAVSLAAARQVFRQGFFTPGGADMGLFSAPLSAIFDAATAYIETRGGEVRLGAKVESLVFDDGAVHGVRLASGETIEADGVIASIPPDGLESILPQTIRRETLGPMRRITWSPIVNLHAWFDRPVMKREFLIPVDSPLQTIFNVSVLHGRDHGPWHLAISQSAASEWIDRSSESVADALLSALTDVLPAVAGATCVHQRVIKHPRATFVPGPGIDRLRPGTKTETPGLYLAGDWTASGWPSTIEGAVRSGIAAAARAHTDLPRSE